MTLHKLILSVGCLSIALVCFMPPQRQAPHPIYSDDPVMAIKATDYYKLATWVTGIAALTGAALFIVGPWRRIVDSDNAEVVAR